MTSEAQRRPRGYGSVDLAGAAPRVAVRLDGRPLLSPAGAPIGLPTRAIGDLVAAEWSAQTTTPDLASMPLTRLAFTAVDRGDVARAALLDEVARYAANDLVCYVAEAPRTLVERQAASWGHWREWARRELGLEPPVFAGVMPGDPGPAARRARELASELGAFELVGLVAACGLLGSAILAFALARLALDADEAHALARLDELWQEAQWGTDVEAAAKARLRRDDAGVLEQWFRALNDTATRSERSGLAT